MKIISRNAYADMYGPTTGDKIRLADTELFIEVEKDLTTYGEEVKFGGGKVIRDGMGQSQISRKDGAVDTVGGKVLENILSQTKDAGIVAACGNAADIKLNTTVMPFIIRGVKLWGINSVTASIKRRQFLWNEAGKLMDFKILEKSVKEINLDEVFNVFPKMLKGETSGRYIINLNK